MQEVTGSSPVSPTIFPRREARDRTETKESAISDYRNIRINRFIRSREVRVIGADGAQLGVMTPQEAMRISDSGGFDLVEISPTANPPVCRIMNFGKYKYDLDLKQREARKKQIQVKIKEVKFHPNVEDHDYLTKLNHILDFLKEGNRVRCSLQFRGRETSHTELGFILFHRIQDDIKEIGHAEQRPNLQGRLLSMMLMVNKDGKPAVVPPRPVSPLLRPPVAPILPQPGAPLAPGARPPLPQPGATPPPGSGPRPPYPGSR